MDIPNLFAITWTPLNVIFIGVFGVLVYVGFNFIFRDMKAIKQSQVSKLDYFFAIFFGVMFAASIMLGALVLMAYGSRVELNPMIPPTPITMARFTTFMFIFLMGITIAYPFIEFMFLSFGSKQTSPMFYQDFLFKKVISKSPSKIVRLVLSIVFYGLIFVGIPVVLSAAGFPLFMGLVTIFQLFPIWLLSRLGAEGYFYGINLNFYNIFERDRFMYAIFDDKNKAERQFKETPIPILAVPVMTYVYINGFVSIVQLVTNPFAAGTTFNFTFLVSTVSNILTALIGFFIKFWRREVKYKVQDTLFAGYLFATLSVNILLTFLVKEPGVMVSSLGVLFDTELTMENYWMLIPAAMIQRVVYASVVTYYFVKGGAFKRNVLDSLMVLSRNRLVPRILLNFSRHPQSRVRTEAARLLDEMYRMHSLKYIPPPQAAEKKPGLVKKLLKGLAALITPPKRKQAPFDYVFDAFGSEHVQVRIAAGNVIGYLFNDDPDQAVAKLGTHLADPDDVKVSCVLDAMNRLDPAIVSRVDPNLLLDRVAGASASVRAAAFKLLGAFSKAIMTDPGLQGRVMNLVNASITDPSPSVQSACLGFLGSLDDTAVLAKHVPLVTIIGKINHPNTLIKQSAIALLDSIVESSLDPSQVNLIVKLLDDRNPGVQRAALTALYAMSTRVQVNIAPQKATELVGSSDKTVALAAIKLVARLADQRPGKLDLRPVLALLESGGADVVNAILQDLGETIEKNPSAFLPVLGRIMERPEMALKEIAKKRLVMFGSTHFDQVLDHILNIKEDARFAVRNFTREILLEVGKLVPDKLIPVLQAILVPEKARKNFGSLIPFLDASVASKVEHTSSETFRVNAASVLGDLAESFPGKVNFKALLEAAKTEESWRVRRDLATSLGKMVARASDVPVTDYLALFNDANPNVRGAVAKGLLAIAKTRPSSIPVGQVASRMGDADDAVRESLVAVAGQIGICCSEDVMPLLVRGLEDEKWPVKNAAAEAMGKIAESTPDRIPVESLKHIMLTDKDKWARWQAAHALSHVVKSKPGALVLKDVAGKVDTGDENMARAYLELLQTISPEPMETFIAAIKPLMASNNVQTQEQVVLTVYAAHGKTNSELLLSTLLKMVVDKGTDQDTLHAAAISLGKIAQYATPELKKRVKKILSSQCMATRDPVVCREFTALE